MIDYVIETAIHPDQIDAKIEELKNSPQKIRVFWHEIIDKPTMVVSRLDSKLGNNAKIMARKCELVEVDYETAKAFANENHTSQFAADSDDSFGLTYNGELVYAFMFNSTKKVLNRIVAKYKTNVTGGYSKLLKEALKKYPAFTTPNNWRWGIPSIYKEFEIGQNYGYVPVYYDLNERRTKRWKPELGIDKVYIDGPLVDYFIST